jgi:hypothetical protein
MAATEATQGINSICTAMKATAAAGTMTCVSCASLLRWALQSGFSLSELGTLMVRGTYEAPAGASMPSIWC